MYLELWLCQGGGKGQVQGRKLREEVAGLKDATRALEVSAKIMAMFDATMKPIIIFIIRARSKRWDVDVGLI